MKYALVSLLFIICSFQSTKNIKHFKNDIIDSVKYICYLVHIKGNDNPTYRTFYNFLEDEDERILGRFNLNIYKYRILKDVTVLKSVPKNNPCEHVNEVINIWHHSGKVDTIGVCKYRTIIINDSCFLFDKDCALRKLLDSLVSAKYY